MRPQLDENRRAAETAGLKYSGDDGPGLRRLACGRSFRYLAPNGRKVRDSKSLKRIRSLAIPPAWRDVWISPHADGHLQACGRDARGRKQYRYHPNWDRKRSETKYQRVVEFAEALPKIRKRVARHLSLPGLPRQKVLATVLRILERTGIRVGNEEYARENRHFGLTTLRRRHVRVIDTRLRFEFVGKSGKLRIVELTDRRVAKVVQSCRRLPGSRLFQYREAGGVHQRIQSREVNDYLKRVAGEQFTAKDFRTWVGTLLMTRALRRRSPDGSERAAKRELAGAIDEVAAILGNTRTVCRSSYVHPTVMSRWAAGALERKPRAGSEEGALLRLLRAG